MRSIASAKSLYSILPIKGANDRCVAILISSQFSSARRLVQSAVYRFILLLCCFAAVGSSNGWATETARVWDFDAQDSSAWEVRGSVVKNEVGPRAPEFPEMPKDNVAFRFSGEGYLVQDDPGDQSFFDFSNGDEITIEAWVELGKVRQGELMYVIGKGRSNRIGFEKDNQNWALRIVSNGGLAQLSFLFATELRSDGKHWHRWTSDEGFGATTGWHHIAISYRFGDSKSIRGWIDGLPCDGVWDMGGATEEPPVVDNDAIAVGSAVHGGKSNQFRGSIDRLAIHREILTDDVLAARFNRTGGRIAWGPVPAEMPEMGELRSGFVRLSISEGWPDSKRWLNQGEEEPEEHTVWYGSEFLLPRLPARFDDWGIRQGWKTPVLLRMAADVDLPLGIHQFLLRGRGLGRLWIDGELIASTKGKYRKATNLESIDPIPDPPMSGGRPMGFSQEEVVGTKVVTIDEPSSAITSAAASDTKVTSRVVLEMIIGGAKLRSETTELTVAWQREGGSDYAVVLPSGRITPELTQAGNDGSEVLLTDQMIQPVLQRIENELVAIDDASRRSAASSQNEFWAQRHLKAGQVASDLRRAQAGDWYREHGEGSRLPAGIDQWVQQKIDRVLFDAKQIDTEQSSRFHMDVLPILREHCFRCHSEKAQGGLSLHQRDLLLMEGDSGEPAVVPGDPEASVLMQRVIEGDMPPGEEHLSETQIAVLQSWIQGGANWPSPPAPAGLDKTVPLVADAAFLRRVYLDVIGLPPREEIITAFMKDTRADKRSRVIDELLQEDGFASHWVSFWMDLLAENPTLLNASLNSTGPFRWFLHDAIRDDKPLDRMVTELIMMRGSTHDGGSAGFGLAGNNDAPMAEKGHILASTFLGIEMQCARCHDSPYHSTTQEDLFSLAAMLQREPATPPKSSRVPDEFFEKQTRESLIRVTLPLGKAVEGAWPFEDETGVVDDITLHELVLQPEDSRERLAALITSPNNSRFPRVAVNHLWSRLIGAGLVEPLHDWEGNTSSHPELLDWLAVELVEHEYDVKHILRLILNSDLYQKQATGLNFGVAPEMRLFHAPDRRRMLAEQVVDSLFEATGREMQAGELTFVHDGVHPMNRRLTLGRPQRAWEFASLNNERDRPSLSLPQAQPVVDVLEAFGWTGSRQKPIPLRDTSPNVLQPGILSNGTLSVSLTRAAVGSQLAQIAIDATSADALLNRLFLRFLSRFPTDAERETLRPVLAIGFEDRLTDWGTDQAMPESQKRFPQITWTNHLVPEANEVQLELQQHVLAGPPSDPRLAATWREAYEDVVWSLVNHREFVWMP